MKKIRWATPSILAGVGGFIEFTLSDYVTNKDLFFVGFFVISLGVNLLIGAKVLKEGRDELMAAGKPIIDRWMYNCGWIALILGIMVQIIAI